MKKMIIVMGIVLFGYTLAHAEGTSTASAGKGESTNKTKTVDVTDSERKGTNEVDDTGNRSSNDTQNGSRTSASKSISKALEKLNSSGLSQSMPLVPIFAKGFNDAGRYVWLNGVSLDTFLVGEGQTDGGTDRTVMGYLDSMAKVQAPASAQYINQQATKQAMVDLLQLGASIQKQISPSAMSEVFGLADWEDLAHQVGAFREPIYKSIYSLNGTCSMTGTYTKIRCGECTIDLSWNRTLPELTCKGRVMFSPDYANGVKLDASINTSVSLRDAETSANTSESFHSFTKSLSDYVSHSVAKSKGSDAVKLKKVSLSLAASNDKKLQATMAGIKKKEDPINVLGIVGLR